MLLLKNAFSVIFFPSRRQSARGFVRGSDCRQKVEYFSSRALNIVLNIFSLCTLSSCNFSENGFADHTVEVLWDSTAGRPLPLGLQSRSDLHTQTMGSPWRSVEESMGLPKDTCLHDLAFCGMIKTPQFLSSFQTCGNRSLPQLRSEEFFIHLRQLF